MANILVVDRIVSVREALAFVLELEGHSVAQAAGAREALDRAEEETFDVVLVDAQLRDLPFADFCTALRAIAPRTSVVVMSLDATDHTAVAPCAPTAFLAKPFPTPYLLEAVALAA